MRIIYSTTTSSSNPLILGNDTIICKGDSLLIDVSHIPGNYLWNNGSTFHNKVITRSGSYSIQISNTCSSTYLDTINVSFIDCDSINDSPVCSANINMPNVFTPNNEGINDYFKPIILECVKSPKLIIYNRWGQIVYQINNSQIKWDGKFKDKKCSSGAYFWILTYQDKNREFSKKGALTLF